MVGGKFSHPMEKSKLPNAHGRDGGKFKSYKSCTLIGYIEVSSPTLPYSNVKTWGEFMRVKWKSIKVNAKIAF